MDKQTELTRKTYAAQFLRERLNENDTVYTILRHVSASGMTRWIDLYTIRDNQPVYLSYYTAELLGYTRDRNNYDGALKIGGCGMDMGFAIVYDLSYALFGDGYKLNHKWL